jgi:hypothetical protein
VKAEAEDVVGHVSNATVQFEIVEGTVLVSLLQPSDGSIVRPGTNLSLEVVGFGNISCSYTDGGVVNPLAYPYVISTDGWADGPHLVTVTATNDIGGSNAISFTIVIDSTPPLIVLESPDDGSFVTRSVCVRLSFDDQNFEMAEWTLWGTRYMTISKTPLISLDTVTSEGQITLAITASDKAGNIAHQSFAFLMDTSDPTVFVSGVSDGAVAKGAPLTVDAEDTFLYSVTLALDEGSASEIAIPAQIDTESIPDGSHVLRVVAKDLAGKTTYSNVSVFVDGNAPSVALVPVEGFVADSSLEISAEVADDFAVGDVMLYYTSPCGALHSVTMTRNGSLYSASLGSTSLWDGMSLYAIAADSVGHVTKSVTLTVHPIASPTGGAPAPGSPDDSPSWSFVMTDTFLVIVGLVIALAAFGVFLAARRRRSSDDEYTPPSRARRHSPAVSRAARIAPPTRPSHVSFVDSVVSPKPVGVATASIPPTIVTATADVINQGPPVRTRLLDAVPEVVLDTPPPEESEQEEDIDYGALIEKELVEDALKRSVYQEDVKLLQVIRELESIALTMEGLNKPPKRGIGR